MERFRVLDHQELNRALALIVAGLRTAEPLVVNLSVGIVFA